MSSFAGDALFGAASGSGYVTFSLRHYSFLPGFTTSLPEETSPHATANLRLFGAFCGVRFFRAKRRPVSRHSLRRPRSLDRPPRHRS